jgi:antitoxin component of RelBE/YafQ-DinJ toxin-antitoxin module
MAIKTRLVTIRINKELAEILSNTAKQDNLNPTTYMRAILETHAKEKRILINPKEAVSVKQLQNAIRQLSLLYFATYKDLQLNQPKVLDYAFEQNEKLFPEDEVID